MSTDDENDPFFRIGVAQVDAVQNIERLVQAALLAERKRAVAQSVAAAGMEVFAGLVEMAEGGLRTDSTPESIASLVEVINKITVFVESVNESPYFPIFAQACKAKRESGDEWLDILDQDVP